MQKEKRPGADKSLEHDVPVEEEVLLWNRHKNEQPSVCVVGKCELKQKNVSGESSQGGK